MPTTYNMETGAWTTRLSMLTKTRFVLERDSLIEVLDAQDTDDCRYVAAVLRLQAHALPCVVVEHNETGECEYVFEGGHGWGHHVPIGRRIPDLCGEAWHRHYGPQPMKPHGPLGP